jgi:uncharacterized protein YaiE (UPF0345 family)
MSENHGIERKSYAEGRCQSFKVTDANGITWSSGIFTPGELTFTPDCWEYIRLTSGTLRHMNTDRVYGADPEGGTMSDELILEPNVPFTIVCEDFVTYRCEYWDKPRD